MLEEPLPAGGACLLGSINLDAFVDNDSFDYGELRKCVRTCVRALNGVLDEGIPLHPLKEQQDMARKWRQIGLGVMGIADMLIHVGISYGSTASIVLCENIARVIANEAIKESCDLAKAHGCYEGCDMREVTATDFFRENGPILEYSGLRNSQLLTIPPCGTLSTMIGISGGIEPIFANSYTRRTQSLHGEDVIYKVYTPIVREYMEAHRLTDEEQLPEYFVTAQTIKPEDRVRMQAAFQRHIDASISSTVNLPNEATVEDIEKIYLDAWHAGLKGITVFRDGCKRAGILSTGGNNVAKDSKDSKPEAPKLEWGDTIEANNDVIGKKRKLTTGCGSLHCTAFFDPATGALMETYLSKGSDGGCNNFMIGLSRMISLAARTGCDVPTIVDQLKSCGSCPSYAVRRATKGDTSIGSCCPMAIGNALLDMWNEMKSECCADEAGEDVPTVEHVEPEKQKHEHKCPECGEPLVFEGGCCTCKACGYSKCG